MVVDDDGVITDECVDGLVGDDLRRLAGGGCRQQQQQQRWRAAHGGCVSVAREGAARGFVSPRLAQAPSRVTGHTLC